MPAELQPLALAVKRLQHKHHRRLDARLIHIGTTMAQWHALRAIAGNPDSSSHKLAGLTFQTDQSFGALANRMVERGLILRIPGEGRTILHRLTGEGEAMLAEGHKLVDEVFAESFAPLSAADRVQLKALLDRVLEDVAV